MTREVHGLVIQFSPFDAQILLDELRGVEKENVGPQMANLAFLLAGVEARMRDAHDDKEGGNDVS